MNEYWEKFSHFVNEKTLRERVIILLVAIVLVYGLCDLFFLGGLLDKNAQQDRQLNSVLESNIDAESELQELMATLSGDAQADKREQKQLQEKLDSVDKELASAATGFIPATLMPQVLEEILNNSDKLTLIKLENKAVELVTGKADNNKDASSEEKQAELLAAKSTQDNNQLFRHGVEMQLQGSYLSTLEYLQRLEQLQWRFQWDALTFVVEEYPTGTVTLEVYTYSTERDWLGV